VRVLSQLPIEKLIITDIYDVAGREENAIQKKVSAEKLVKEISNTKRQIPNTILHIPSIEETEQYLKKHLKGGEVIIVMGAGDIYTLTLQLQKRKMK